MLKKIQQFFESTFASEEISEEAKHHATHLAAAGLMVEVMRADFVIDDSERASVQELVRGHFDLSDAEADEILSIAEQSQNATPSLYPMVQTLVQSFSIEERTDIVELLWRVAFADGKLDKYEEACIRKVSDLLYVPHPQFMLAKHRATQ